MENSNFEGFLENMVNPLGCILLAASSISLIFMLFIFLNSTENLEKRKAKHMIGLNMATILGISATVLLYRLDIITGDICLLWYAIIMIACVATLYIIRKFHK